MSLRGLTMVRFQKTSECKTQYSSVDNCVMVSGVKQNGRLERLGGQSRRN